MTPLIAHASDWLEPLMFAPAAAAVAWAWVRERRRKTTTEQGDG